MASLSDKLSQLPLRPGVYLYRSSEGEIIYVGKAARLRNRVKQYFQQSRMRDAKTSALITEIADLEWIETESEIDALFLESELVKRYMPRYNVLLRDDKSETFVRIDLKSPWPTVTLTRTPTDDGAEYIGPFYNAYPLRRALRYLRRAFPYYTRPPKETDSRLEQQIGIVPAREGGEMARLAYKANLRQLVRYLKGERKAIVKQLEKEMKQAASEQRFEEAAKKRNQLTHMKELQRRVMFGDSEMLDISKDLALVDLSSMLGIDGPLRRIECIDISHHGGDSAVAGLVVFMNGVSSRSDYRKFRVGSRNDDYANMTEALSRRFSVKNLQQWPAPDLLVVDGGKGQLTSAISAVRPLAPDVPIIGLAKGEEIIIVHTNSKVSIDYKNLETSEDVEISREADFVAINLHPGQLNAGKHSRNLRGAQKSHRYRDVTKLLQRLRDESHRFAVSYHHNLRAKSVKSTKLLDIPGVGAVTQRKLIRAFGSLRAVGAASEHEIADVVGPVLAARISRHLSAPPGQSDIV